MAVPTTPRLGGVLGKVIEHPNTMWVQTPGSGGAPCWGWGLRGIMSHHLSPPDQWGEEAGEQHSGDADQVGCQPLAEGMGQRA